MGIGKQSFYLSFPIGYSIKVIGEFAIDLVELGILANNYLPGVKIVEELPEVALTVEYIESELPHLEIEEKTIRIFDQWKGKLSLDIWHMLYSIMRKIWMERGEYPVHAACVGNCLLVGHTGVGKSTILFKLLNDTDWKVFSGNKTIITIRDNFIEAIAGTKSMSLRDSDSAKYPKLISKKIQYADRMSYLLDDKHLASTSTIPINRVFLIYLNDGVSEAKKIEHPSSMHALYPYVLDAVNADTIMCQGKDLLSGEVARDVKLKLIDSLSKAIPNVEVYRIVGSPTFITTKIVELS